MEFWYLFVCQLQSGDDPKSLPVATIVVIGGNLEDVGNKEVGVKATSLCQSWMLIRLV